MILTPNIFINGKYKIPNTEQAPNGADYREDVQSMIDVKEREILIDGLGFELFETLKTEYADFGNASQPIKDLVDGKTYELEGKQVRYEGLSKILTPYIYYHFLNEKTDVFTTMGIERPQAENSSSSSSLERASAAYRDFLKGYQGGDNAPKILYRSGGVGIDYFGSRSAFRSLYDYLVDNADDYPTAGDFVLHESMNSFGI